MSDTHPLILCQNSQVCNVQNNTFEYIMAQNVLSYLYTDLGSPPTKDNNVISLNIFRDINALNDGGAIYANNVNLNISFNEFTRVNNSIMNRRGGAILIEGASSHDVVLLNNSFTNCCSFIGGAISFLNHEPLMLGNSFANNSAFIFGDNFASYPQQLGPISEEQKLAVDVKYSQIP